MGRVINPDGVGKERTRLVRSIVFTIRELLMKESVDSQARDMAAYIALSLLDISKTIDTSVEAWEKRGYWVKADRFRIDWAWTESMGMEMRKALIEDDWQAVALTSAKIMQKLNKVNVPKKNSDVNSWEGAWQVLNKHKFV